MTNSNYYTTPTQQAYMAAKLPELIRKFDAHNEFIRVSSKLIASQDEACNSFWFTRMNVPDICLSDLLRGSSWTVTGLIGMLSCAGRSAQKVEKEGLLGRLFAAVAEFGQ